MAKKQTNNKRTTNKRKKEFLIKRINSQNLIFIGFMGSWPKLAPILFTNEIGSMSKETDRQTLISNY